MKLTTLLFATAVAGAAVNNDKEPITISATPRPTEPSKFPLLVNVWEHADCTGEKRSKYLANDGASGGHIGGEEGFSSFSLEKTPDTDDRWTIHVVEHRDGSGGRKDYHDRDFLPQSGIGGNPGRKRGLCSGEFGWVGNFIYMDASY